MHLALGFLLKTPKGIDIVDGGVRVKKRQDKSVFMFTNSHTMTSSGGRRLEVRIEDCRIRSGRARSMVRIGFTVNDPAGKDAIATEYTQSHDLVEFSNGSTSTLFKPRDKLGKKDLDEGDCRGMCTKCGKWVPSLATGSKRCANCRHCAQCCKLEDKCSNLSNVIPRSWILDDGGLYTPPNETAGKNDTYPSPATCLHLGSRIAAVVTGDGTLRYEFDGVDQGVAATGLPVESEMWG
eukprot:COSAG03_NODE_8844_length_766_cov_0.926537_1_plen_236_part_10